MVVSLTNEPCGCPHGQCASFVEPAEHCVNRRSGRVTTAHCRTCNPDTVAYTWHEDGKCLACEYRGRLDKLREARDNTPPQK